MFLVTKDKMEKSEEEITKKMEIVELKKYNN